MIYYNEIAKQNNIKYDLIERWEEDRTDLIFIEDNKDLHIMINELNKNKIRFETDNHIVEPHYITIFY